MGGSNDLYVPIIVTNPKHIHINKSLKSKRMFTLIIQNFTEQIRQSSWTSTALFALFVPDSQMSVHSTMLSI